MNNLLLTQGKGLLILFALLFLVSFFFAKRLFWLVVPFFVFTVWFFRNPERTPEFRPDIYTLFAPSDGKIVDVQPGKLSIFLSPVDVHVNWLPIAGTIRRISYTEGKFLPAFRPESSRENEQNEIEIVTQFGESIIVRQVAGTIARRIVCWVNEGDAVSPGQKFGMIKFGSRIDMLFPESVQLYVKKGQRIYGGETAIGSFVWR